MTLGYCVTLGKDATATQGQRTQKSSGCASTSAADCSM
jgi:hypothetical protein